MRHFLLLFVAAMPAVAQSRDSVYLTKPVASNGAGRLLADGVYSEIQASRGDTVFRAFCASCHAPTDLIGEPFRMNWFGRTVYDYFRNLRATMPEDNIGGLTDDDYTRVTAYILKINGYRAGADSLSSDSAQTKRIVIGPASADSSRTPRRR